MQKTVFAALATLALAAGCATGGPTASTAGASAAAGAQYCKKDRLSTEGDTLVCNWAATVKEACASDFSGSVSRSAVRAGPQDAGRCANGQWLVSVTTK